MDPSLPFGSPALGAQSFRSGAQKYINGVEMQKNRLYFFFSPSVAVIPMRGVSLRGGEQECGGAGMRCRADGGGG